MPLFKCAFRDGLLESILVFSFTRTPRLVSAPVEGRPAGCEWERPAEVRPWNKDTLPSKAASTSPLTSPHPPLPYPRSSLLPPTKHLYPPHFFQSPATTHHLPFVLLPAMNSSFFLRLPGQTLFNVLLYLYRQSSSYTPFCFMWNMTRYTRTKNNIHHARPSRVQLTYDWVIHLLTSPSSWSGKEIAGVRFFPNQTYV